MHVFIILLSHFIEGKSNEVLRRDVRGVFLMFTIGIMRKARQQSRSLSLSMVRLSLKSLMMKMVNPM
jgi:hypothetical protein